MTLVRRLPAFALSAFVLLCAVPARPQAAPPAATPQPPAFAAPAPAAATPKAADLIREAVRLEQQRNFAAARQKLDQAKDIDPKEAFLWANYAVIASTDGKLDEAIEDFQRELANHPDEENFYMLLAQTQAQQNKPQDAIVTLQKLTARNPANDGATRALATMMLNVKQYPDAEKLIRDLLVKHPDDIQMQLLLSTALARGDHKSDATALLKSVIEKSQNPNTLNDAAFALADENLDLPLAEQTARRALAMLEQQASPIEPERTALLHTAMFVSFWDTLGWTLFREGKTAEAEPLIRASWANGLSVESGYHLGMVLEKMGQPAKAMAVYQEALWGDPSSDAGIRENTIARQAALLKAGTPNPPGDGKSALQALYVFKVPGPNKLTGQALMQIEFSPAGAANATVVKDTNQDSLTPVETSLYHIDYKTSFPAGSHAILTRRGILTCHTGTPCQFALLSLRSALSN